MALRFSQKNHLQLTTPVQSQTEINEKNFCEREQYCNFSFKINIGQKNFCERDYINRTNSAFLTKIGTKYLWIKVFKFTY